MNKTVAKLTNNIEDTIYSVIFLYSNYRARKIINDAIYQITEHITFLNAKPIANEMKLIIEGLGDE